MLTQLSEKVFILQDLWNPTHRNPSKCLLLLGSLLFCLQNAAPTPKAKLCMRKKKCSSSTQPPSSDWKGWTVPRLPLAGVDLLSLCALLAFNVAAPAHLALARPGHLPALSVVASPATDSITVFVLVAFAGCSARGIFGGSTETGWVLDVEQVHSAGDLIVQAGQGLLLLLLLLLVAARGDLSLPGGLVGGAADLDGGLVTLLQLLADLMEGLELPPTGLDGAGARYAVAFASGLHSSLDYLDQRQSNTVNHWEPVKAHNERYAI